MAEDTMLTFKSNELCKFINKDEMREKAPFVFATAPTNPNTSKRYVFASTETIIDDMAKLGWGVTECKQQRANKRSNIKSFHMVAFQNPNVYITKEDENGNTIIDAFPRIILQNSHDGFHGFRFMIGMFRLVCSNGLIVATEQFADIRMRHINYTFDDLREVVAKAISQVGAQVITMNTMQNTILTDEQKKDFAIKALRIRKGIKEEDKMEVEDETISEILEPTRNEDKGNDLWSVFNVIQEKMIHGMFQHSTKNRNGRRRKARAIKGIAKDTEINQGLYKTAMSYCMAA